MFKKIFFIACSFTLTIYGQSVDYKTLSHQPDANFYEIVSLARQEFILLKAKGSLTRTQAKAEKQFERWVYNWKNKVGVDGKLPSMSRNRSASNLMALGNNGSKRRASKNADFNSWEQIGPVDNPAVNGYTAFPGKGRINVVAEDPNNTNIMYAGAASGGVWKTTDNGSTWIPLTDNFAGLGVTDILIDPNNTNIVYVATGDEDGTSVSSIGLFKSTNSGSTWEATGLTFLLSEEEYIRDIAFEPGNSNTIYALTNREIKKSTNAGASFSNANVTTPFNDFTENFQTIVFDPNTTNVVVSDYFGGVYVSTDSGENFDLHRVFEGDNQPLILKLSTTPDDTEHFYGINEKGEFSKYRFNFNNTADDLIFSTTIAGFDSQEGYNMPMAISPTNKNHVIVGGVNGYISTDNGASFSLVLNAYNEPAGVGFYVHPDHHHFSFLSDGVTVLNGHDGGIHKGTFNGAANTWVDLSPGLVITQSYNIAITQSQNGDDFIMANQDNDGFSKVEKDGKRQWVSAIAGDGTSAGINFNNTKVRYLGSIQGWLDRTNDGYASRYDSAIQILPSISQAAFVSPMVVHPVTPTTIYAAHSDLKKSTNQGDSFTALNTGLETIDFVEVVTNGPSTRIYVINEEGECKRSDNDGVSWTSITSPSGQMINSFAATPNSNVVYATVRGYSNGNKVFKSVNNGSSWTNISDGLPNIVMNEVILKVDSSNETLYVASELGVYSWNNTTNTWSKMDSNLPNVRVDDLKINYTDQDLYAGTYGRGMWRINIEEESTLTVNNLTLEDNSLPIIYPNPVTDGAFRINLPSGTATYTIYSVLGGILKSGKVVNDEKIDVSNLSKGIYLLKVYSADQSLNRKLIIR